MFSRAANNFCRSSARRMRRGPFQQRRTMGGGGHAMEGSPQIMENAAEVFGTICWLWVFHRSRLDLPWVLGFRHPWDHVDDGHGHGGGHGHGPSSSELVESWDKFTMKAIKAGEDDDDDDEDEDDDEDDDDEDDDE